MREQTQWREGTHRNVVAIAAVCVAVLVGTGATVVAWDRLWRRAGPTNPGMTCPDVVSARHRPPLAAPGVHKVALIGDSLMFQPSCAIAESLAGIGIETSRHAVSGSGLLNGSVDWVARTRRIVRAEHPNVVVAIFVGNYWPPPVRDAAGQPIGLGTPAFFAAWQRRAVALSTVVRSTGARMYWVSPPPIALPPLNNAQRLFDGYRRIRGVHVLDSGRILAGSHGKEVPAKTTCGRRRIVRSTLDAVHLTDDGARIYGQQIAHDLS